MSKEIFEKFRKYWKVYLLQSGLVFVILMLTFFMLETEHVVVFSSIGATAFTLFAMPSSESAKLINVNTCYLVGILVGSFFAYFPQGNIVLRAITYALSVSVMFLFMISTSWKHPPSAGVALGITINGFSWDTSFHIFINVLVLSLLHLVLKKYLFDFNEFKKQEGDFIDSIITVEKFFEEKLRKRK